MYRRTNFEGSAHPRGHEFASGQHTAACWLRPIGSAPRVVAGATLWLAALALPPAPPAGIAAVALVCSVAHLARGGSERWAVRTLRQARPLSASEAAVFSAVKGLLTDKGTSYSDLYVQPSMRHARTIDPVGRHSVVLTRALLDDVLVGAVGTDSVVAGIAHAAARRVAAGGMPYDIVTRAIALPADALMAMVLRIFRFPRVTRCSPAGRLLAFLVTVLAIAEMVARGAWWLGLLTALVVLALACSRCARRSWASVVEAAADREIISAGLGDELASLLLTTDRSVTEDRIAQLGHSESVAPAPAGHLHLVM